MFLALSASSPFLDGRATGYHSTRWSVFPQTPAHVPLFIDHRHFVRWTEEQLAKGTMQNVRHLWTSVRPNGDRRPYNLNRLELRICDLVSDPLILLAITALLEARLLQLMKMPLLDPLESSCLATDRLLQLVSQNEAAVARHSLEATLHHWKDGNSLIARDWVEQLYQEVWPTAKQAGFSCFLAPLKKLLRTGNEAQQWLELHRQGMAVSPIMHHAIQAMTNRELTLQDQICQPLVA